MLIDRLRTSAVIVAIASGLLYLDARHTPDGGFEGLWLLPLVLFFGIGTVWDITGLLTRSGRPVARRTALMATTIITLSAAIPMAWPLSGSPYPPDCPIGRLGWIAAAAVLGTFLVLIREMIHFRHEASKTIERTLAGVFVSQYVGLPMALLLALRGLGDGRWGLAALLTTIAVAKSADAGAYFVGRSIGRTKLIPWLSPGKTWEGVFGGIAASTLVAYVCLRWGFGWIAAEPTVAAADAVDAVALVMSSGPAASWAFVLGPVLAISGMIGDLAESLVKRGCNAKDSGNWLPGLGGVWDVTDSLIAAVMPAFLCFAAAA